MLSVRFLGGARIESEDRPLQGTATQRHRLALLAVLVASYPRPLPRDKLIACLWPERDLDHARNLLNQAVHALRRALGAGAILSAGDELRFEPGELLVDVIAFEAALASGEPSRALELYAGPFLDGFFLPDAPEFEAWLDGERDRLRRAYWGALEALAEGAMQGGDPLRASGWWRRLAAEEPYNARVTLRLMEALAAAGDRPAAIQQARLHALLLQQEFGAEPDLQVESLAELLRSAPAFPPPLEMEQGDSREPSREETEPAPRPSEPSAQVRTVGGRADVRAARAGRRSFWRAANLMGVVVIGIASVLWLVWQRASWSPGFAAVSERPAETRKSIAVLPLENLTGQAEDAAFGEGIHSDLITALSGIAALTVISRASVLPYRESTRPLTEIGKELGADVLLEGALQRVGDRVRVNVQLSDAHTGHLIWARSYEQEVSVGNLFALQRDIAEGIVTSLQASLTPAERARLAAPATENLTTYLYYHRAGEITDNTRAGNEEAERLSRLALELDPQFAPAWARLAATYGWRSPYLGFPTTAWDSALVYARRALELDPNLAEGYTVLALTYGHQGHLARQEEMARQALRRNPSDALATRRLAESYRERGAFLEALRYHRESVRLSPNSPVFRSWVAHVYVDLGEHAEAERWYQGVLSLRPDFINALQGLAILNLQREQQDSARYYADRIAARYPDETVALASVAMIGHYLRDFASVRRYAGRAVDIAEPNAPVREVNSLLATTMLGFACLRTGEAACADSLFDQSLAFLEGLVAHGTDTPRWPYEIALIHAARGETEAAITWLETAYDRGFRWAWMLGREPMLDPLREDPRFRGLLARIHSELHEMRRQDSLGPTVAAR